MTLLDEIVRHKRKELAARQSACPVPNALDATTSPATGRFKTALVGEKQDIRLILEVKPASPSAGVMAEILDLEGLLETYNPYAAALSVLTDERYFRGSLELLSRATRLSPHPILCKDFILEPCQVDAARQAGAEAVLLIVKILSDEALSALSKRIRQWGMTPVVEVQTEEELNRALACGPEVLLINNRNLETFAVDLDTTARLAPKIPSPIPIISASGMETRADLEKLLPYTTRFLIGSALMKLSPEARKQRLREFVTP